MSEHSGCYTRAVTLCLSEIRRLSLLESCCRDAGAYEVAIISIDGNLSAGIAARDLEHWKRGELVFKDRK